MLLLLGDQLIRDAGLAVFELVKNAYDADASRCEVILADIDDQKSARIIVEDDGSGMDYDTVVGTWLEPGTDYRATQRSAARRSPKYKRLPLGEKGVGRFAVHKLGRNIELITRQKGEDEVVVTIDWSDFEKKRYLSDVAVDVRVRAPEVFSGYVMEPASKLPACGMTGRSAVSVSCTVRSAQFVLLMRPRRIFSATLQLKPDPKWLKGLLDAKTVLDQALYRARRKHQGREIEDGV